MMKSKFSVLSTMMLMMGSFAAPVTQPISESPPGTATTISPNAMFAFSVEFPTAGEAYTDRNLDSIDKLKKTYIGYFDPDKCYEYVGAPPFTTNETYNWKGDGNGYFSPAAPASLDVNGVRVCTNQQWSGNLLNWATMSAIDVVRYTLTGGNRAKGVAGGESLSLEYSDGDTKSETYLRRAFIQEGRNRSYGFAENQRQFDTTLAQSSSKVYGNLLTPFLPNPDNKKTSKSIYFSSKDWKFSVKYVVSEGSGKSKKDVVYIRTYNAIVKVCIDDKLKKITPEPNCRPYGSNFKPEGLIQKQSEKIRFGVFGYLLDDSYQRDGGVLRARLKYTGKTEKKIINSKNYTLGTEWDANSGQFVLNPDVEDAVGSGVKNSGVINAINKFGDSAGYKQHDPGAELFYAALRYYRNKATLVDYVENVSESMKDGFPVISTWDDPIQYSCQKNFIIYMGDTNTHGDVDLPGSTWSPAGSQTEIRRPPDDDNLDVDAWLKKINANTPGGVTLGNTGSSNSPSYMAALAYWAHVNDIRPDLNGMQNISAFMIDTVENNNPKSTFNNAFYLAGKWGGFGDKNNNLLPDLDEEWRDATRKVAPDTGGLPKNYAQANNPDAMVTALESAIEKIGDESKPLSLVRPAVTNTAIPPSGSVLAFFGSFNPSNWTGDVVAQKITEEGLSASPTWRAQAQFKNLSVGTRKIFTMDPSRKSPAAFTQDEAWLTALLSQSDTGKIDGYGAQRIAYLRGDQAQEKSNASPQFRPREQLLGDIVNSIPVYVSPNARNPDGCAFSETAKKEVAVKALVAVGANDGMAHVLDAASGDEVFAYIPSSVQGKLASLTNPLYGHRYYVDGPLVADNICIGNLAHRVLVGTTGLGGAGVFALDVTTVNAPSTSNILWEFTANDDPNLGKTVGQPQLARLNNGKYAVLVGNGLNKAATGNGKGSLFVLYLDGPKGANRTWVKDEDYLRLDVPELVSAEIAPNALLSPSPIDVNQDGKTDVVYVGDINGQLWKFDLSSSEARNWRIANRDSSDQEKPIFTAYSTQEVNGKKVLGQRQAIVAPLLALAHPKGGLQLLFGTGKLFSDADRGDLRKHALYGLRDPNAKNASGYESPLGDPVSLNLAIQSLGETTSSNNKTYQSSSKKELAENDAGWTLGLLDGERVLVAPSFVQGRVQFTSLESSGDACEAGGKTWITELRALNGKLPMAPVFDTNADGSVNEGDQLVSRARLDGMSGGILNLKSKDNTVLRLSSTGETRRSESKLFIRVSWREIIGVDR